MWMGSQVHPCSGFLQMYTLICNRSWAMQNNFTVPFIFYPKLKRSQTDQHPHHTSLTELLICICHCTIHTRGQCERHQDILLHMLKHITLFCLQVQATLALIGLESGDGDRWHGRRTSCWRNYTQYMAGSIFWSASDFTSSSIIICEPCFDRSAEPIWRISQTQAASYK